MGPLGAKPTNWKGFKFSASSSRQLGEEQRCHIEWFIPTFYIKCILWRRQPGLPHLLTAVLCAQLSSYLSGSLEGGEAAVTAQELLWSDLFMVVDVLLGPCYFYVLWQPISGNGWWSTVPITLSVPCLPTTPHLLLCNLSAAVLLSQVCSWLQDDTLPLSHFGSGFQRGMHPTMSGRTGTMLRHWRVPLIPGHYVYLQKTWVRGSGSAYFWVIETELLSSRAVGWQL